MYQFFFIDFLLDLPLLSLHSEIIDKCSNDDMFFLKRWVLKKYFYINLKDYVNVFIYFAVKMLIN